MNSELPKVELHQLVEHKNYLITCLKGIKYIGGLHTVSGRTTLMTGGQEIFLGEVISIQGPVVILYDESNEVRANQVRLQDKSD